MRATKMNDAIGTELKTSDFVCCTHTRDVRALMVAQVVRFTNQRIVLRAIGKENTFTKYPDACVKISDDVAVLYLLKR